MTTKLNSPIIRLLFTGLIALILQGCAVVGSEQPMGLEPASIVTEEWDGNWVYPGGSVTVKVADQEQGLVDVAWIDTQDDDMRIKSFRVVLKRAGEWLFGSIEADEKNDVWLWARIDSDPRQIIFWTPDPNAFKQLVRSGKLPGRIDGDDVTLGTLQPAHFDIITGEQSGSLFVWDEPMVFMRIRIGE